MHDVTAIFDFFTFFLFTLCFTCAPSDSKRRRKRRKASSARGEERTEEEGEEEAAAKARGTTLPSTSKVQFCWSSGPLSYFAGIPCAIRSVRQKEENLLQPSIGTEWIQQGIEKKRNGSQNSLRGWKEQSTMTWVFSSPLLSSGFPFLILLQASVTLYSVARITGNNSYWTLSCALLLPCPSQISCNKKYL